MRGTQPAQRGSPPSVSAFGKLPMLLTIFPELQLEIARFLTDPSDCAALCLAVPRGLGLAALRHRGLPQYKDILVSVAMRLATGELQIDEALLRRYLWDRRRMTSEGCKWLTAAAQRTGSPLGIVRSVLQGWERWHLTAGGAEGALVRRKQPNGVIALFEGERGAERKVRAEWPDGTVSVFEGEKGDERRVRVERPDGSIFFFEGEKYAEREVRAERPDGRVFFFEGEKDAERLVREQHYDGRVFFFEGERDAERRVRLERLDGSISFFEGERDVERWVRRERPDGTITYFEGERKAERKVRVERPDGGVIHYAGERGAERIVREELPDGTTILPPPPPTHPLPRLPHPPILH